MNFQLNWIIDRNITVSYFIVDGMHQEHPELVKDQYWDQVFPNELPYNVQGMRTNPPEASTARLDAQPSGKVFVLCILDQILDRNTLFLETNWIHIV